MHWNITGSGDHLAVQIAGRLYKSFDSEIMMLAWVSSFSTMYPVRHCIEHGLDYVQ